MIKCHLSKDCMFPVIFFLFIALKFIYIQTINYSKFTYMFYSKLQEQWRNTVNFFQLKKY